MATKNITMCEATARDVLGSLSTTLSKFGETPAQVAAKNRYVFNLLRALYTKRKELDKKRRAITLVQSFIVTLVVLKIIGIDVHVSIFSFKLDEKNFSSQTLDFLMLVVTLLTPLSAKFALIEFILQKVYFLLLK